MRDYVAVLGDDLALCPGLEELSREELTALVREQAGLIIELREANAALKERVRAWSGTFRANSGNSSMPPSSDDLPGRTRPAPKRAKNSGRRQGMMSIISKPLLVDQFAAGAACRRRARPRVAVPNLLGVDGALRALAEPSTVDDMRRRAFLGGVVAASVGSALGNGPDATHIKPASYYATALHTLIDNDNIYGSADVIPRAEAHIVEIGRAWANTQGRDRAELVHLRARFAELAAWLYEDLGNHTLGDRSDPQNPARLRHA